MNAVAKRLRPKPRRVFSHVRATQASLRSVEEIEREKPRRARGLAAVALFMIIRASKRCSYHAMDFSVEGRMNGPASFISPCNADLPPLFLSCYF